MGVTARGLRYPELADRPDGAGQMLTLAEDIEAVAAGLIPDSGTRGDLPVLAAEGFELIAANYRLLGKNMTVAVWLKRTGTAIVATAAGNISDTTCATITDTALRPSMDAIATMRAFTTSGEASLIAASGNFNLVSMQSSSTIATHSDEGNPSIVRFYSTYAVP